MSQEKNLVNEIERLIDELEGFAERSPWYMPHKIVIHEDDFFRVTQHIRELLPPELADAKETLSKRDLILKNAQEEHRRILDSAERRLNDMTSDEQVVVLAQQAAERIIENANHEAETLKRDALLYTTELLVEMEGQLSQIGNSIQKGREYLEEEMNQQVEDNMAEVQEATIVDSDVIGGNVDE